MKQEDFLAQYQTKEWYELSKRIKARDKNTCQMCGRNDKPLGVHHLCYGKDGSLFDVDDDSLITLCEDCHIAQIKYKQKTADVLCALRTFFTDFEIYNILCSLYNRCYNSHFFLSGNTRPTDKYLDTCFWGEDKIFAKNILEWRERVRMRINKDDAIHLFRSTSPSSKEKIKEWFYNTYGEPIDKYVNYQEEVEHE